jgi:hypothetical protein
MEELFPLLVAAGYFLLRLLNERAKKAQQQQRAPRPDRSHEGVGHPLESADPQEQTRLERRTSDAEAPETLGEALERIRAVLEGDAPQNTPPPAPPSPSAPLPAPSAPLPKPSAPLPPSTPASRPVPQRMPVPAGRIETAEDRFERTGRVFRAPQARPEKPRPTPKRIASRARFLRAPGRLRDAILAAEILGPPRSKRRR